MKEIDFVLKYARCVDGMILTGPRAVYPSCSNTESIRDDSYWTSRKNSLELIELSSINKVSLV